MTWLFSSTYQLLGFPEIMGFEEFFPEPSVTGGMGESNCSQLDQGLTSLLECLEGKR